MHPQGWVGLALVGMLLFAGCLEAGQHTAKDQAEAKRLAAARLASGVDEPLYFIYDAQGKIIAPPPGLETPLKAVQRSTERRGGEPNVGVTAKGSLFVVAGQATMRSQDQGRTWKEVFNLTKEGIPAANMNRSSDPMLWVDPITNRIYTDHMFGLYCSNLAFSDDEGNTWTQRPLACGIPVNDHQKLATAPYGPKARPPVGNPVYPNVVYYCYNKLLATDCAVSLDGGLTFAYDRQVAVSFVDDCGGINGHPASGPDGTVFVPMTLGCNRPVVGVSEDNGLSWTVRNGPDKVGGEEIDPEITVTPDGTAYMLWRGKDHLQYLARSKDKFEHWEGPWKVSPPHVRSTVFAGLTSGDNGRIAMAYLGTEDTNENPQKAPNATRWNVYLTYSLDASAASPTFATVQVNPSQDPVQIGCVWLAGGSNPCRNMLDFIDMTSDAQGRVFVSFTDGCTVGCAYNATANDRNSRGRTVSIATVIEGPSLRLAAGRVQEAP